MAKQNKITLETLGGGVLKEKFEDALAEVIGNIADPNTSAKGKRTISIDITVKPGENRLSADYEVSCKTKLQPARKFTSVLFINHDEAYELKQERIAFEENITELNAPSEKGS